MSAIAIRVEHLSKLYRIGARQNQHDTLRDALVDTFTAPLRRWRDRRRKGGDRRRKLRSPSPVATALIWLLPYLAYLAKRTPRRSASVCRSCSLLTKMFFWRAKRRAASRKPARAMNQSTSGGWGRLA